MDLTITLDSRYQVAPDGSVWSQAGMARGFWERYLEVFDRVKVVARGVDVKKPPVDWLPVTGPGIDYVRLPDFHGPAQYLARYPQLRAAIRAAAPRSGAVIMRVGSQIANVFEARLNECGYPYALEVIGDPYDVFAPGVVEHPLRRFFRWHFSSHLRRQCAKAIGVAYVTRKALQERYPTKALSASVSDVDLNREAVIDVRSSTYFSSIELDEHSILNGNKRARQEGPFEIVTVGSMAQMYKGFDVLLEAMALCVASGFDLRLVIAGEGQYKQQLIDQARLLKIQDQVRFAGQVTAGQAVRSLLDHADLFVLPSKTEGLPRAMIEAMARALPCIGTRVGGIPELLEPEELVDPGDAAGLAQKLQEILRSPSRMERLSRRNREVAMEYRDEVLKERRRQFYWHVHEATAQWERRHKA